nr:MAG TPA: hypothetical protein [Caudoviricetes sp.]
MLPLSSYVISPLISIVYNFHKNFPIPVMV